MTPFPLLIVPLVVVLAVLVTYSALVCQWDLKNAQQVGNVHMFLGLFLLELTGLQNLKREHLILNLYRFLGLSLWTMCQQNLMKE